MFDDLYLSYNVEGHVRMASQSRATVGLPKKNAIKTTGTIRKLSETNNLPDQLAKVDQVYRARDTQIEGLLGH